MEKIRSINMFDYIYWVSERHNIWELRQNGREAPWTEDPLMRDRKYCNVFRVLDRESQYSVKRIFSDPDASPDDFLLRAMLFRITIRQDPWEYFFQEHGRMPMVEDLLDHTLEETWEEFHRGGGSLFKSGVYLVHIPRNRKGTGKMEYFLEVIKEAFLSGIGEEFSQVEGARAKLKVIQQIPRFGPFMSQQVLTDVGYSLSGEDFENDYVEIGPGSERGLIRLGYGTKNAQKSMRKLQDKVHSELPFVRLPLANGDFRYPSLMDIQNTLCEVDKYARLKFRESKSNSFSPIDAGNPLPELALPKRWSIEDTVKGNTK